MPNEPKPEQTQEINSMSPAARHNARRYALQAMYKWCMDDTTLAELEAEFIRYHIDKKLDLVYFKELIHGIPKNLDIIDDEIRPHLGRAMSDIDPIELNVLRIAIYELMQRPDVPYRVVINEALELTKKFGSIEGHKFVNGVLDKAAKKIRPTEINMKKDNR